MMGGGKTCVAMMQTADLRNSGHLALCGRLDGANLDHLDPSAFGGHNRIEFDLIHCDTFPWHCRPCSF